jgi:hypothetical protein
VLGSGFVANEKEKELVELGFCSQRQPFYFQRKKERTTLRYKKKKQQPARTHRSREKKKKGQRPTCISDNQQVKGKQNKMKREDRPSIYRRRS